MSTTPFDPTAVPEALDREQAFMLYAAFSGDIARTAHALSLPPAQVCRMVDDEGWVEKLRPIIDLKKSNKPGDFERGMNRAVNFVQAHRLRLMLERALNVLLELDERGITEKLIEAFPTKDGQTLMLKVSARSFADLASAIEKAHALSYSALGDTGADRSRRADRDGADVGVGDMHVLIADAMSKVKESKTPRAALFDITLRVAQEARVPSPLSSELRAEAGSPLNNDEH